MSLTSEIESTWEVVIESGLTNVLLGSLSSFSVYPGDNDSEVIMLFYSIAITDLLMILFLCLSLSPPSMSSVFFSYTCLQSNE